jgi:hypothetical protein
MQRRLLYNHRLRIVTVQTCPVTSATRLSIGAVLLVIIAPVIIFYSVLFGQLLSLPLGDDYYALLNFVNDIRAAADLHAKAQYFLISQYNEYKLFFEHAVFWAQLELLGHLDLKVLCIAGNSFVLWLAILLWKMFLPHVADFRARLTLFMPIPWLLFQLQYAQTLNFAMAGLQNLPVLLFSFATIHCLLQETRLGFLYAQAFLVLAVSSSGNGLLMIPIGVLILAFNRNRACLTFGARQE